MPFLRTFAPFVAGVAQMTRSKFTFFDVTGGALWVGGIVTRGLLLRQRALGQDAPGQDHLGDDHHPRPVVILIGAWKARPQGTAGHCSPATEPGD